MNVLFEFLTFPSGGKEVEVGITRGGSLDGIWSVPLQNIFLIGFDETCTLLGRYTGPAVIVRLPTAPEIWAVALSTEVLNDLRSVASPLKSIRRGFDPGAAVAETPIPRDIKEALYVEDVKSFVLARARLETGRTYDTNDVSKAMGDLLATLDLNPTVLGMSVPSKVAVRLFPSLFLGLSLVLWHRVRRIPNGRSDVNEPWIMLHPKDWAERVMALGWSALLLGAGALIAWAAILLSPLSVAGFAENIARTVLYVNLVLIVVAEVVLLLSLGNVLRINTGRGWVGWGKHCVRNLLPG